MIEVEKKFVLNDKNEKHITENAKLISEKKVIDTYYDTEDYDLAKKDWWLRNRNGQFELKIGFKGKSPQGTERIDHYKELETEDEIKNALHLKQETPLEEGARIAGYLPYTTLTTIRRKYKEDDFTIDLDEIDYGYKIGEIELLVENEADIPHASEKIENFAKAHGLETTPIRGKIVEWIRRNAPEKYQQIKDAWKKMEK